MKGKKKFISIVTAAMLCTSTMVPVAFAADETADASEPAATTVEAKAGLENFAALKKADKPAFSDVQAKDWFAENVCEAYQYGLMKGTGANAFTPNGNLTLAEAVTLAARICDTYNGEQTDFTQGDIWYQVYLDYAVKKGILSSADRFADYTKDAKRSEFAQIIAAALPESELPAINEVTAIPDVDASASYANDVYKLYRAGILTGKDEKGAFLPNDNVTRAEVSTIVVRLVDTAKRVINEYDDAGTAYDGIVSTIIDGMQNGWKKSPEEYGLSYIYQADYAKDNLGFVVKDINGDGVDELLLGEPNAGTHGEGVIYDLYTTDKSGNIVHLFSGGERNRLYLTKNGQLVNEGSNGADDSFVKCYELKDAKLMEINLKPSSDDYVAIDYDLFKNYVTATPSGTTQIANPWEDTTAKGLMDTLGVEFGVPKDAKNVRYSMCKADNMAQMTFELNGEEMTARIQPSSEAKDISGLYVTFDKDKDDTFEINGIKGTLRAGTSDGVNYQVCQWFDAVPGLMYSLSVRSKNDLNGFDITAVANEIYVPTQTEV